MRRVWTSNNASQTSGRKEYKGFKKIDRTITFHHIHKKQFGGKATIENGANIAAYNHEWLHQQSEEVQSEINEKLQEFKLSIDMSRMRIEDSHIDIDKIGSVDLSMTEDTIDIPLYENKKQKFNRAKVKEETQRLIEEELYR